jgi:succinate dehydrogenase/fumarate reductase-like Fe-S protein
MIFSSFVMGAKSMDSVSVTDRGWEMSPIFSVIELRREIVSPFSFSYNCAAMTAICPSDTVSTMQFPRRECVQCLLLREPCPSPMGSILHPQYVR